MPTNINPPGLKTGFQHPRCFASRDANCSRQLSREHAISETLLRQVEQNNTVKIAGLKWQETERFKIVPINGLASKVLCERHNNALSPLDSTIGELSLTIREFDHAFREGAQGEAFEEKTFSGDDIQLWMLKCLIGMSVSGNLNGNMKSECVEILYGRSRWPAGWGLYWLNQPSLTVYHTDSFAVETAVHRDTQTILLAKFLLRGMHLGLCLGIPDNPQAFGTLKPAALIFRSSSCERRLLLRWENATTSKAIFLERVGAHDGPPPDWREWEQKG